MPQEVGGWLWRGGLGRGKVGAFLRFILCCSEATEFA